MPSQVAKYSEWIAWRGLIPRVKFEEVFGKEQNIKSMHLGQGRHILHFPVRSAQFINIVRRPLKLRADSTEESSQVAFVRDPDHVKLGDKTGPWQEERPSAEMLLDFAGFTEECQNLLRVRLPLAHYENPRSPPPSLAGHRETLHLGHLCAPRNRRNPRRPYRADRRRSVRSCLRLHLSH